MSTELREAISEEIVEYAYSRSDTVDVVADRILALVSAPREPTDKWEAVEEIVVEAIEAWGPTTNAHLFADRIDALYRAPREPDGWEKRWRVLVGRVGIYASASDPIKRKFGEALLSMLSIVEEECPLGTPPVTSTGETERMRKIATKAAHDINGAACAVLEGVALLDDDAEKWGAYIAEMAEKILVHTKNLREALGATP